MQAIEYNNLQVSILGYLSYQLPKSNKSRNHKQTSNFKLFLSISESRPSSLSNTKHRIFPWFFTKHNCENIFHKPLQNIWIKNIWKHNQMAFFFLLIENKSQSHQQHEIQLARTLFWSVFSLHAQISEQLEVETWNQI